MTPIKRCPWCGNNGLTYSYDNLRDRKLEWYVQCYNVLCSGRGPIRLTEEDAIASWNKRQLFGEGEDGRLVTKEPFIDSRSEK